VWGRGDGGNEVGGMWKHKKKEIGDM